MLPATVAPPWLISLSDPFYSAAAAEMHGNWVLATKSLEQEEEEAIEIPLRSN